MSSKKPPQTPDIFTKYLDEKFNAINSQLVHFADSDKNHTVELKELNTTVGAMAVTLGQQKEQLATHIRRTDILENDLRPVKSTFDAVVKGFGFIAITVTVIAGVSQIYIWLAPFLKN